jgi:regulator of sigma E protease
MSQGPGFLVTVLSFLLAIGPLIFLHELGHYLAGRAFGVRSEAFSIGFGPELFGWTDRLGTRWRVAALPLGGYVKFAGDMNPASTPTDDWLRLPPAERAVTFQARPPWQRFLIVAAGPVTNFLIAVTIFVGFFACLGEPRTPPIVDSVAANSAAAAIGLRPGDRIVSVESHPIDRFEDISAIVTNRAGERLPLQVERGGRTYNLVAVPHADVMRDRFGNEFRRGLLGIRPGERVSVALAPGETIVAAVRHTGSIVQMMVETIWQVVSGRRSVQELGGPLKIAEFSGQQASLGWLPFVEFIAMISINLGFINLLPIPTLDGGHLVFYALEGIRRRPLPDAAQIWAYRSGLVLLLSFMIFVTANDLGSLGLWQRLAGLIG